MSRIYASLLSCFLLTGCGVAGALETPAVATKAPEPRIVGECLTQSPPWERLPDRDIRRSELARLWRLNESRYQRMAGERRICRAGLKARRA